uniref:Uncharacterized protein LOC114335717 n=1 Tax=Diabrotica virgifera virgifera TaxID=50390 RepID=A0A6P7G456_DIAVI
MYAQFQRSLKLWRSSGDPCLTMTQFGDIAPIFVIDCSRQNEAVKSGSVDMRIEIETNKNIPANTSAYYKFETSVKPVQTCSTPVQDLFRPVQHLFKTCSRPVQHLFKTCSKPVHHLFMTCSRPVQDMINRGSRLNRVSTTNNFTMDKDMKRRLITKRKNIQTKLRQLKQGQIRHEDLFNPITKHLKNIESKLNSSHHNSVVEKNEEPLLYTRNDEDDDDETDEPSEIKQSILDNIEVDDIKEQIKNDDDDDESLENLFEETATQSRVDYWDQYDPLPRKYIKDMQADVLNKEFDHKYGVRFDEKSKKLLIGNSEINMDGADVILKNKRYKGTPGLYELLFKKSPANFTPRDKKNYQKIVVATNAHRRHYRSSSQIYGSKLTKYKKIIAPITKGKGMLMEVSSNKIDYIHWDDPNELVGRLMLLLSSQLAGHTGHTNEINSIIEELKEATCKN